MTAKRRRKLQSLAHTLPRPSLYGSRSGQLLLIGWGSTMGPIREAVDRARAAGQAVAALHLRHLHPLPLGLEEVFEAFDHIRVVEMNDEGIYGYGQLAGLLRARYRNQKIRGINKSEGMAFKVREILEQIRHDVAEAMAKN
jgi:2-oxoglutarate ferredoxin oxidoreductase subunit alpha